MCSFVLGMRYLDSCEADRFGGVYRKANDLSHSDELPVPKDHMILGRLAVRDFTDYRVIDRMLMYERRIESSMYRAMKELERLQKARKAGKAHAADSCRGRSPGSAQERLAPASGELNQPHPDDGNRDEAATRRPVQV